MHKLKIKKIVYFLTFFLLNGSLIKADISGINNER
mgnify:CR=1